MPDLKRITDKIRRPLFWKRKPCVETKETASQEQEPASATQVVHADAVQGRAYTDDCASPCA